MKFEKNTIDAHLHIQSWFDKQGRGFIELYDEFQKNLGLKALCLNALGDNIHGGVHDIIMAALYKLHNPTAYANGGLVYPEYPLKKPMPSEMDPLTQYNELMEIGFDGIKILYKPDVTKALSLPINDELYEPMFQKAEKDGTQFLWHLADPEIFWNKTDGCYGDGTYYSFKKHFELAFDVIKKHPNLSVTFAHFLFLSEHPEKLEEIFEQYPKVTIDVTPGTEMYDVFTEKGNFYKEFFEKYKTRILYGTDGGVTKISSSEKLAEAVYTALTTDQNSVIWGHNVKGLALPDSVCKYLLYGNFVKLYGETPKPINKPALKQYIEKYSHLIINEEEKIQILQAAETL